MPRELIFGHDNETYMEIFVIPIFNLMWKNRHSPITLIDPDR